MRRPRYSSPRAPLLALGLLLAVVALLIAVSVAALGPATPNHIPEIELLVERSSYLDGTDDVEHVSPDRSLPAQAADKEHA
ncbi:hypothetical protein IL38_23755 [Actinopolyspora erythraea]|uniref:Uncharacterized protein n=1 Tax=Actinopolyspora erythraea TaxID=414996 RepID=A0ABR4WY68_9ACTN|nr:hypothetical protein [Actinopolyspora erythraea]KGI79328.1 hypothetical protein IL38_23755 [Actinopolyspora erythraea]